MPAASPRKTECTCSVLAVYRECTQPSQSQSFFMISPHSTASTSVCVLLVYLQCTCSVPRVYSQEFVRRFLTHILLKGLRFSAGTEFIRFRLRHFQRSRATVKQKRRGGHSHHLSSSLDTGVPEKCQSTMTTSRKLPRKPEDESAVKTADSDQLKAMLTYCFRGKNSVMVTGAPCLKISGPFVNPPPKFPSV